MKFQGFGKSSKGFSLLFNKTQTKELEESGFSACSVIAKSYDIGKGDRFGKENLILVENFDEVMRDWQFPGGVPGAITLPMAEKSKFNRIGASNLTSGRVSVADFFGAPKEEYKEDGRLYIRAMTKKGYYHFAELFNGYLDTSLYDILATLRERFTAIYLTDSNINILGYMDNMRVIWDARIPVTPDIYKALYSLLFRFITPTKFTPDKCMIGLDLEFAPVDADGIIHEATEYVADNVHSTIGTDGFVKLLEIRPEAFRTANELFDRTKNIIRDLNEIFPPGHDIACGGGNTVNGLLLGSSIGTHIHFSGYPSDNKRPEDFASPNFPVKILDYLLYHPIKINCRGWERADGHYGQFGSWRNKYQTGGDGNFPHLGFEWRGLPNVCFTKELLKSILVMSESIMKTWASGIEINFPWIESGGELRVEHYSDLYNFEDIIGDIDYYVRFINSRPDISGHILSKWFRGKNEKIEGAEIRIYSRHFGDGTPLIMFHERKVATICVVNSHPGSKFIISHNQVSSDKLSLTLKRLSRYITIDLGRSVEFSDWRNFKNVVDEFVAPRDNDKQIMVISIPGELYERNRRNNRGSRDENKMMIQKIIKNI